MSFVKQDYNKYEKYIRVGTSASTLALFPTPSSISRSLKDVDLDAYTDLKGYTQRNRIRHDVEQITIGYNVLSDDDIAFILNAISPVWFYVEVIDKKTKQRKVCKMYASDKDFNVHRVSYDESTQEFVEEDSDFQVTFTEQ